VDGAVIGRFDPGAAGLVAPFVLLQPSVLIATGRPQPW